MMQHRKGKKIRENQGNTTLIQATKNMEGETLWWIQWFSHLYDDGVEASLSLAQKNKARKSEEK